jgi:DNA-binding NtrC family response regulator
VRDLPPRYRPALWQDLPPAEPAEAEECLADVHEAEVELAQSDADLGADAAEDDLLNGELLQVLAAEDANAGDASAMLPQNGIDLRSHLSAIERALISQALHRAGGTVAQAARLLHLRRTTLVEKLRKLGMATA